MELYQQKTPIRAFARQLGLHRSTVHRYVDAGEFPEMAERRKLPVKLDPYLSYLEERWEAGCRNRLQLWREICERGFDGTHKLVYIWTKRKGYFKKGAPKSLEQQQTPQTQMVRMKTRPWAASRAAWLLVLEKSDLKPEEVSALERMIEVEPLVDTASKLAHEFRSMLSNRQAEMLSDWMQRASKCGIEPLKSFVGGMKNDLVAISLAFSLPWSNGPTEGNVNRLKLIKRQMYGRANFDLLRRRVLGMPSAP